MTYSFFIFIYKDTSDKDTGDTTEQEQQSLVSRKKKEAPAVAITDMGPNLDRLWAYQAPISKGRNVSCIAWNKVNSVRNLSLSLCMCLHVCVHACVCMCNLSYDMVTIYHHP